MLQGGLQSNLKSSNHLYSQISILFYFQLRVKNILFGKYYVKKFPSYCYIDL